MRLDAIGKRLRACEFSSGKPCGHIPSASAYDGVRALTALMGLSLLCDGVLNLSVALCTVKIVDYQRPDVIETDDYEIGKDE